MSDAIAWDDEFDLIVVGSGAGALVGALAASSRGLRVTVLEKTELFGGTTAYSGGGMWLPNNEVELAAGVPDTQDLAREYVDGVLGSFSNPLKDAYLAVGPSLVEELRADPHLDFWWMPFPDYFDTPGSLPRGRAIFPEELDAVQAGDNLARVRPPLWPPTDPLIWGHAFVARLLNALEVTNASVRCNVAMERLVFEDDRVCGVETSSDSGQQRLKATQGVLLACGGFERNREMRLEHQGPVTGEFSLGAPGNTGDGIRAGIEVGAATAWMDQSWWTPCIVGPSGGSSFLQGLHGGLIVNSAGVRYANECLPYDQFGREMLAGHATGVSHLPSYLIFDQELLDGYGIPSTPDGIFAGMDLHPWFDQGLLYKAESIAELATLIDVPGDALEATVTRFNGFAKVGVDEDFGRGATPYDRFFVAPVEGVNATLKQLRTGPFYAALVTLGDLGTKGGLVCDDRARVLDEKGVPIHGLYAAGNTMAAWTGEHYLGPGVPIGSSVVFGYLAALDAAAASVSHLSASTH